MTTDTEGAPADPVRAAFDAAFYRDRYPDVGDYDPFDHYMIWGWLEGRDPTRTFSTRRYQMMYPDIAAARINPFEHYVQFGQHEGRVLNHDLGFRYEVLSLGQTFEHRVRDIRRGVVQTPPDPISVLAEALAEQCPRAPVHITVSHDDFTSVLGGVQLCVRLESEAVRRDGSVHLHLLPSCPGITIEVEHATSLAVLCDGRWIGVFDPRDIGDALAGWVGERRPSFAVHSLIGHRVDDVIEVLKAAGATTGHFWVHDFSSVCSNYALMRNDVAFCGAPPMDSAACSICHYLPRRRIHVAAHLKLLNSFDITVAAPSQAALNLWRAGFPAWSGKSLVHAHASLSPRSPSATPSIEVDRPLRVGFLGMPMDHKGWPVFTDLVERFRDDPRYEFHHLGKRPDPLLGIAFTPVEPSLDRVEMTDAVERLDLDIAVIWSLCPETFCFTAYEAIAGGCAIVTNPDAGNVPHAAAELGHGRVLAGEAALTALFDSGEALGLSRSARPLRVFDLAYSRMTMDLLAEEPR